MDSSTTGEDVPSFAAAQKDENYFKKKFSVSTLLSWLANIKFACEMPQFNYSENFMHMLFLYSGKYIYFPQQRSGNKCLK